MLAAALSGASLAVPVLCSLEEQLGGGWKGARPEGSSGQGAGFSQELGSTASSREAWLGGGIPAYNESDLKSGPAVRVFLNGLAAAFGAVVIVFWLPSLVWE